MRKTSQDGGEYPATSAVENELKKPKGLLSELKTKKIVKRTAPDLSEESDDAVIEPLLQKCNNSALQSAKYLAKAKADTVKEITKLFNDKKSQHASTSGFGTTETLLSEKDQADFKTDVSHLPLHNHMNTNVFHGIDNAKVNVINKTQVLVEIDGSKQSGSDPSPLIFTTAKIHSEGKSNHMDPVQMTPAPILSTVEVTVSKGGNIISNEKKIDNGQSIMNISFSQPLKPQQNSMNKSGNLNKPHSINNTKEKTTIATNKPDKSQLNSPLIVDEDSISSTSKLSTVTKVNIPVATNYEDTNKILGEPSISEIPISNIIVQTRKSSIEENKFVEPSVPFVLKTHKKENLNTIDSDSSHDIDKSKNIVRESEEKEDERCISSTIEPIVLEKQTISSTKPFELQKNITATENQSKKETKMNSSKNSDCLNDSSAKASSSTNTAMQSKITEIKLNTDIDTSLKLHAKDKSKFDSKISVNPDNAPKESLVSSPIVKLNQEEILPASTSPAIQDPSKNASLNINPKANIADLNTTKSHVKTTSTSVADTIHSNANKIQAKTKTDYTDSSVTEKSKAAKNPTSINENVSKVNKSQTTTATSMTDKCNTNTDIGRAAKITTSMVEKPISNANKTQVITATAMTDQTFSKADKTKTISITPNKISDKASSNIDKSQGVPTTSEADKPGLKSEKTQTLSTMTPTPISDKAIANANKNITVTATSIADTTNLKAIKTQTIPTKTLTSDKASLNANKTQTAISIADKTGKNSNKSQPSTTKAATSAADPTSSKVNKITKTATPTNTKSATNTKTPIKPISVSIGSKTSANKSPITTTSAKIPQVASPGSTTAKPLVGKTAQVSASTTKLSGTTSLPKEATEHSKINKNK